MAELFDAYRTSYNSAVNDSISFSGLKHDFFLQAKADLFATLVPARVGKPGKEIAALDVGCGVGAFHPHVRGVLPHLQGCDISSESIARARQDNSWVDYRHYSGARLPYEDASFDFAFAICVAHHVPPADWPAFFAEMARVVRPGGIVAIIEHNPWNPLTRLAVLRCPFDEDAVLLSGGKTAALLEAAGMAEIERRYFLLFPFANPAARRVEGWMSRAALGAQYACSARV